MNIILLLLFIMFTISSKFILIFSDQNFTITNTFNSLEIAGFNNYVKQLSNINNKDKEFIVEHFDRNILSINKENNDLFLVIKENLSINQNHNQGFIKNF